MLRAMPGRKMINTSFADYDYKDGESNMVIHVTNNSESFDVSEIKNILKCLPFIKRVEISGIKTQALINDCFKKIRELPVDVVVDVHHLKNIYETSWLDIEYLNSRHKINFSNDYDEMFDIWAHRLNNKDKEVFRKLLSYEQLFLFHKEELAISALYNKIIKKYPKILSYSDKQKFDLIFSYMVDEFPYCNESLRPDRKGVKPEYIWTQNALGTFEHKEGVCEGRSKLIRLLANSSIFKLPCYTASGKIFGDTPHCWNQIIINGRVLNYDSSWKRMSLTYDDMNRLGYVIESEEYPVVKKHKQIHL